MKSRPIILSAAVGALLVWIGLLVKGRSIAIDDHSRYQDQLSEQIQSDLIINQAVIEIQQQPQPSYEFLVQQLDQVTTLQRELETIPSVFNNRNSQQFQEVLEISTQLLTQKAELAEQFQVQNLKVKDLLSALSLLISNIKQESFSSLERQIYELSIELLNQVLLYALGSDEILATDIQSNINQIRTLVDNSGVSDRNDIDTVLEYANVILAQQPEVEQLSQELLALPTTQQLQTLSRTYESAYHTASTSAKFFQLAAVLWGATILGILAYLWVMEQQSHKVEKITNFLSESIDDAFIDVNNQWLITYVNRRAAEDLDMSPEDLIGQLLWTVLPTELGQGQEHYYQEALSQQAITTFETRFLAKSQWLELRLSPSSNGLSIFWQDISSHKKAEFQLALSLEANDEALKKAHDAQKKAETERLKAEQASQAKSAFLANMSHELRTPLNAIIGYSEMLEEDAEDLDPEDFIPELQKIQGAGKHLLGLINDVLDLSKVEAGHMELYLETFEIKALVQEVALTMKPVIAKNNNTLHVNYSDDIDKMYADPVKVRQSLFNLLSNASKFTQDGKISVSVSVIDGWIDFQIQDTGIGMMPEQLQKIFNAFAQADSSTTRKYGGTGLGLTITKRFIQMMGGHVNVQSEINKGTTFTLQIPKTVQDGLEAIPPDVESESASAPEICDGQGAEITSDISNFPLIKAPCSGCVLVIDEDKSTCKIIWQTLVSQGYFVVLTHNGRKGVKMADQLIPDVIILDVIMLEANGWRIARTLKNNPKLSHTPIILQTTMANNSSITYSVGVEDYLSKPISPKELLTVVNKYQRV